MKFPRTLGRTRSVLAASALVLAGFGGGAVLAATGTAGAVTASTSSSSTNGHSGETALTGTTAAKVKAAALAKYPGATVERVETDSDGVYEAHLTTKAGDQITVQVNKSFAVTGTQTGGRHGDHDGDATDSSSSTS
jgi:ABC-type glycerol-3-phosphate transport system substrate-binding protein